MTTIYVTDREGKEHVLEAENGLTLMEPLREIDDGIEALCGGMCSCATCHVYIDTQWSPKLSDRGDDELELLEDTECFQGEASRLSCQITITGELDGLRVVVAPEE
jgi:2Fe-2S ferredoxin